MINTTSRSLALRRCRHWGHERIWVFLCVCICIWFQVREYWNMYHGLNCAPPTIKFIYWNSNPTVWLYLDTGSSGSHLKLNEVTGWRSNPTELWPSKKSEKKRSLHPSSSCENTARRCLSATQGESPYQTPTLWACH